MTAKQLKRTGTYFNLFFVIRIILTSEISKTWVDYGTRWSLLSDITVLQGLPYVRVRW
jgi:hypothetical protein